MSDNKFANWGAVILAAGKGTRLNCVDMPKVMLKIGGKPIVEYILETLSDLNFKKENIFFVVGFKQEIVREYFGDRVQYAVQEELKGTAHAAYTGMLKLPENVDNVLVLNGDDSAFYNKGTLEEFISSHEKDKAVLSLLSVELQDPTLYGRIVRHQDGRIEIIEKEYLTDEQKKVSEVSTGTFCFNRKWYEEMFPIMPPMRKIGEYGLPAALSLATKANLPVQVIKLKDNNQWFGVNTKEERVEAEKRKQLSARG